MRTFLKRPAARVVIAIGLLVGLAAAWYLISPLFVTTEVNDDFPMAATAEIPDDMTIEEVELEMEDAADEPKVEMAEPMPDPGPTALASGDFSGVDSFHQGSGVATVYRLEDGSRVLRLEDFDVTNGPDLHVLLSTSADPEAELGDYVDLGSLKGNVGNQNYEIADDADLTGYVSVVIYCQPFHVVFATAPLN